MTLRDLIDGLDEVRATGNLETEVAGLAYDSRRVRAGDVFFALAGAKQDGARFVRDAVAAGAVAVVSAPEVVAAGVAHVIAAEPRRALGQAACRFHGHPSRAMTVVGITGTNGKTTTSWMLESIFREAGWSAGVIGTTGVRFAGETRSSAFTTPEAPELQALLAQMRVRGVRAVAMEVSSHALAQRRTFGLECDAAIFTNLTQDHLDFHGTMEAYLDAKLMLFDGRNGVSRKQTVAVVNSGDPVSSQVIAAAQRAGLSIRTFRADESAATGNADLQIASVVPGSSGLDLQVICPPRPRAAGGPRAVVAESGFHLRLPMLGRHNAANAAAAMTAAFALGLDRETVARGLEALPEIPGRLERVGGDQPFTVVVDYAHTPDALERALAAMREHVRGRLLLVFGCGGDRDRGKRPRMGAAAARGADAIWVTNDNPRGEEPAAIAGEIVAGAGAAPAGALHVELDRRVAIAAAMAAARPGDGVLVAGKGHETTQTVGARIEPFDDRVVVRELLSRGRRA